MTDGNKEIDLMIDVIIPSGLVIGLFLLNGTILFFIYRKRKTILYDDSETFNVIGSTSHSTSLSLSGTKERTDERRTCGRQSLRNGDAVDGIKKKTAIRANSAVLVAAERADGGDSGGGKNGGRGGDGDRDDDFRKINDGRNEALSTSNSGVSLYEYSP